MERRNFIKYNRSSEKSSGDSVEGEEVRIEEAFVHYISRDYWFIQSFREVTIEYMNDRRDRIISHLRETKNYI